MNGDGGKASARRHCCGDCITQCLQWWVERLLPALSPCGGPSLIADELQCPFPLSRQCILPPCLSVCVCTCLAHTHTHTLLFSVSFGYHSFEHSVDTPHTIVCTRTPPNTISPETYTHTHTQSNHLGSTHPHTSHNCSIIGPERLLGERVSEGKRQTGSGKREKGRAFGWTSNAVRFKF